jgi:hypothetical protein
MITKDDLMPVLLEACPSFCPEWHEFLDYWRDDADDPPRYLALADLARHLIAMLERGDAAGLARAFRAVERLLVEGDDSVRELAAGGLLDSLQNENLHPRTAPASLRHFLGPESARRWAELEGC